MARARSRGTCSSMARMSVYRSRSQGVTPNIPTKINSPMKTALAMAHVPAQRLRIGRRSLLILMPPAYRTGDGVCPTPPRGQLPGGVGGQEVVGRVEDSQARA